MTRRKFLRWLAGAVLTLLGGAWWWESRRSTKPSAEPAAVPGDATPAEATPAEATPEPATPRPRGELLVSLFLLSDMHISVGEASMTGKLRQALDDLTSLPEGDKPAALVFGGDLTDFGRDSDYRLLQRTLGAYKLPPLHGNMGNHDYYDVWLNGEGQFSTETMPNGKTDEASRRRFLEFIGQPKHYYDTWINGVHLILVSQDLYVQEKSDVGEGAWYTDEQLNWLRTVLEPHKDGRPALVFIHQPLPSAGQDGGTHRVIRAKLFREILAPYPNVFVFSGHSHVDLSSGNRYAKETFHWFMNASVGRTRGGSGKQVQSMQINVYEGAVAVKGREHSNQTWIPQANWEIPLV